jgi:WD40-like Beta Propeller Repeat
MKNYQTITLLLFAHLTYAQAPINLGRVINSPLLKEENPSISGNGKILIFEANSGEDEAKEFLLSTQNNGVWAAPAAIPSINSALGKLVYTGAPCISHDGNSIFYSSTKSGGVGGGDIYYIEKTNTGWTAPKNLAKPVNSAGYENDPCLSPDGKFLYFTRTEPKKGPAGQACSKIFVSERLGKDSWKEPKELPTPVNMGCEANPRMLSDNKTLLFASIRSGGKGGYDIYRTQLKSDGSWAIPQPMTNINTDKDEIYVSVPATGDYIFFTGPNAKSTDIFKTKIPDNLQPEKVLLVQGTAKNPAGQPVVSRVNINSLKENQHTMTTISATGNYTAFMRVGDIYDFSITSGEKGYAYYSDFFDLDTVKKYKMINLDAKLEPLKVNTVFPAKNIFFENNTEKFSSASIYEFERLIRLLKDNPTLAIEIGVYTPKVLKDSASHDDLTEMIVDNSDTSNVKTIYHNDKTQKQSDVIAAFLTQKGISTDRVKAKGYGDQKSGLMNHIPLAMQWVEIRVLKE